MRKTAHTMAVLFLETPDEKKTKCANVGRLFLSSWRPCRGMQSQEGNWGSSL